MVNPVHISSSLRLLTEEKQGVRTFSGIRPDLGINNVHSLMRGFNALSRNQITNAMLSSRISLVRA